MLARFFRAMIWECEPFFSRMLMMGILPHLPQRVRGPGPPKCFVSPQEKANLAGRDSGIQGFWRDDGGESLNIRPAVSWEETSHGVHWVGLGPFDSHELT